MANRIARKGIGGRYGSGQYSGSEMDGTQINKGTKVF
jgi:hypothetical protein